VRKLFVIGTSGLAKEMAQLALEINSVERKWEFSGYVSRDASEVGNRLTFGPVVGDDAWLTTFDAPADVILGIGYPGPRRTIIDRLLRNSLLSFPNLIHPSVTIQQECVRLGKGNAVTKGCVFTCDIVIGDFNLFNWNVTVGHDCAIGSFNVLNPGSNISGNVRLGDETLIGAGATILENLQVSSRTVIGAGALLTRNVADEQGVYVGVPAKRRPL
jgi:sugar O-acyltransferase (sialic acid O-acetyltransferase NeuD family)